MKRLLKITSLILASFFLLTIAGLIILPYVIDLNKYKDIAVKELERSLNREVSIDDIKVTILTGIGVELKNIKVKNHPEFSKGDLLTLDGIRFRIKLLPLIKGRIEFNKVIINKPNLLLEKNKKGDWNFSNISEKDKLEKPAIKAAKEADKASFNLLAALLISDLELKSGSVKINVIKIKDMNIKVKDISIGNPIKIDASWSIDGSMPTKMKMDGTLGPVSAFDINEVPVNANLKIKDIDLSSYQSFLGLPQDNKLSGKGYSEIKIKGKVGDLLASGKVELDSFVFDYKTGRIRLADVNIPVDIKKGVININELKFRLYEGASKDNIRFDMNGKEPQIKTKLHLESVQMEQFLKDLAILKVNISGPLLLDADIDTYVKDKDATIAKANGSGFFIIKNGKISDLELIDKIIELGYIAASKPRKIGKVTEFDELSGHFRIEQGYLKTEDMRLAGKDLSISAKGYYGLLNNELNFDVAAKVEDNNLEFKITGTTEKPKYVLKTKRIQQNIIKGVIKKGAEKGKLDEKDVRDILKDILK
ncbi:MAG: AsmA family protein [Nitrospirae bacterium]|nr:AsmA family protein [Nitrospirota bacterium]